MAENLTEKKLQTKVSHLYYIEDLNQQVISERLNISRTKVSRCLARAKKNKIIEIKINAPWEKFHELENMLERKFKIKQCVVVPFFEDARETCENIAISLADVLDRILNDGDFIGVGWGLTLKTVVSFIIPLKKLDIRVIPLLGGLGKVGIEVNTNSVASSLAEKFGGLSYAMHSPAVLDNRKAKQILEKDSNITEIFEMSEKISTAIIGMSDIGKNSTMIKTGNFKIEDFKYLKSLGVVGDVNLIFINEKGLPVENRMDERIVRAHPSSLKKIKNVIGIAFGTNKTKVITGALLGQMINILITDELTARSITENINI